MDCEDPIKKYLQSISENMGIQDRDNRVLVFTNNKQAIKDHFFIKSKCTSIDEVPSRQDFLILTFRNDIAGQQLMKEFRDLILDQRVFTIQIKTKNIIDNINEQLQKMGMGGSNNMNQSQVIVDTSYQQQQPIMQQSAVIQQEQPVQIPNEQQQPQYQQQQENINNNNSQQFSSQPAKQSGDSLNMLIKTCLINPVTFEQLFNELKIRGEWELIATAVKNEQLLRRVSHYLKNAQFQQQQQQSQQPSQQQQSDSQNNQQKYQLPEITRKEYKINSQIKTRSNQSFDATLLANNNSNVYELDQSKQNISNIGGSGQIQNSNQKNQQFVVTSLLDAIDQHYQQLFNNTYTKSNQSEQQLNANNNKNLKQFYRQSRNYQSSQKKQKAFSPNTTQPNKDSTTVYTQNAIDENTLENFNNQIKIQQKMNQNNKKGKRMNNTMDDHIFQPNLTQSQRQEGLNSTNKTSKSPPTNISDQKLSSQLQNKLSPEQLGVNANGKDYMPAPRSLNIKTIEIWINDTLMQASNNGQVFEKGVKKAALKKYNIDRKTLKAKGINALDMDRLYRCLFVYSFGFYEMLGSIFEHGQDASYLIAQIWKVFAVLLEYCSRNDFQTTVNYLENEKKLQVNKLNEDLQKKEDEIKKIEERDKTAKQQLLNELSQLNQEKENILIEKNQIEEDYKLADQAFNDEVALRIKFEHKINEIHGIHRELLVKHNRLIDDMQLMREENKCLLEELNSTKQRLQEFLNRNSALEEDVRQKDIKIKEKDLDIEILRERQGRLDNDLQTEKTRKNKEVTQEKEKERVTEDLKFQLQNTDSRLQTANKNIEEMKIQLNEVRQDKAYFEQRVEQQKMDIAQHIKKCHDLEIKSLDALTAQRKAEDKTEQIRGQMKDLEILKDQINADKKQLDVELEFARQRISLNEKDIQALQKIIEEMKVARAEMEEQFIKTKLRLENINETLNSKTKHFKHLEITYANLSQEHQKVDLDYRLYQQKSQQEQELLKSKIIQLEKTQKQKDIDNSITYEQTSQLKEKFESQQMEIESLRKETLDVKYELKTERFNHQNTQNINQQLVISLQQEEKHINDLMQRLGEIQVENEQIQRENKTLKLVSSEQLSNSERRVAQLEFRHKCEIMDLKDNHQKIHTMQYEDLYSQLVRAYDKLAELEKLNQQQKETIKRLTQEQSLIRMRKELIEKKYEELNEKVCTIGGHARLFLARAKKAQQALEKSQMDRIDQRLKKKQYKLQLKQKCIELETCQQALDVCQQAVQLAEDKFIETEHNLKQAISMQDELQKNLKSSQQQCQQLQQQLVETRFDNQATQSADSHQQQKSSQGTASNPPKQLSMQQQQIIQDDQKGFDNKNIARNQPSHKNTIDSQDKQIIQATKAEVSLGTSGVQQLQSANSNNSSRKQTYDLNMQKNSFMIKQNLIDESKSIDAEDKMHNDLSGWQAKNSAGFITNIDAIQQANGSIPVGGGNKQQIQQQYQQQQKPPLEKKDSRVDSREFARKFQLSSKYYNK